MKISRNHAHDLVFQTIYSFLILETCDVPIDVQGLVELIFGEPYNEVDTYSKETLIKALKNQNEIIEYASKFLNKWKFKRLNYCMQAILIMAITEFMYIKEIEKPIIINISVKLAKKYGDGKDYRFINGVLGSIQRNL